MSLAEVKNIKPEEQAEILIPIFKKVFDQIAADYSQKEGKDYSAYRWWMITEPTRVFEFDRAGYLMTALDLLDKYFSKEERLFYFLERPAAGLVQNKPRFWLFQSLDVAKDYFRRQDQKPADFKTEELKSFPYIDMAHFYTEAMRRLVNKRTGLKDKAREVAAMLKITKGSLSKESLKGFEGLARVMLAKELYQEVTELTGATEKNKELPNLPARFQLVHNLSVNFYIRHNEVESEYIKKLMSSKPEDRLKALKLVKSKLDPFQGIG